MPNKDRTGPNGEGPKTGRQNGNCEGAEPLYGRGCGRGFGRGRNFRNRGYLSPEKERKYLENEKNTIEKRLEELK